MNLFKYDIPTVNFDDIVYHFDLVDNNTVLVSCWSKKRAETDMRYVYYCDNDCSVYCWRKLDNIRENEQQELVEKDCRECDNYNGYLDDPRRITGCNTNSCYSYSMYEEKEKIFKICSILDCNNGALIGSIYCLEHDRKKCRYRAGCNNERLEGRHLCSEHDYKIEKKESKKMYDTLEEMVEDNHVPNNVIKLFKQLNKVTAGDWYEGYHVGREVRIENVIEIEVDYSIKDKFKELFEEKRAFTDAGSKERFIRLKRSFSSPMALLKYLADYKEPKPAQLYYRFCLTDIVNSFFVGALSGGLFLLLLYSIIT